MQIKYEVKGKERKAFVNALAEIMECPAVYKGVPTCNYEVDYFTIDREGTLIFDDMADSEEIGSYGYAITGIKNKESIKILKKIFLLKKFNITSFDLIVWTNSMAFAVIPYNEDKVLMNIKCIENAFNITSRLSIKDIFDMIKYNFNINEGE